MGYLGFLCLGAFVGGFLVLGLSYMTGLVQFQQLLATILSAAFGGAVFGFIQYLGGSQVGESVYMYPVGLLLSLLWYYARYAGEILINPHADRASKIYASAHVAVLLFLSGLALALVLFPAVRSVLR